MCSQLSGDAWASHASGHRLFSRTEMGDGVGDVGGVPEHDRGDDEVEAGGTKLLRLGTAVGPEVTERPDFIYKGTEQEHRDATAVETDQKGPEWRHRLGAAAVRSRSTLADRRKVATSCIFLNIKLRSFCVCPVVRTSRTFHYFWPVGNPALFAGLV